jgi:hypothetical protein
LTNSTRAARALPVKEMNLQAKTNSEADAKTTDRDRLKKADANYFSGTWSMNLDLAAGSHTLIAKAVDPSGLTTAKAKGSSQG